MASQGYHLTSIFLCYRFKKGEPETATIRKDFRRFENKEDFLDYQALFEDSGWKHLAGTKNSGDQYFKKIDEGVIDDIFSDKMSKAARYQRFAKMCFELADRKSTRLNSSHVSISYAVFCLKKNTEYKS